MKYIKVSRSDTKGHYVQRLKDLLGAIEGEFDGLEFIDLGTSITLTVVEMSEEEYDKLPEFQGW